MENLHYSKDLTDLYLIIDIMKPTEKLVLCDENSYEHCYPRLKRLMPTLKCVVIPAGEESKNLESVTRVWDVMNKLNFDRDSLLINLGGGMITDLGGFAASCYKRGVRFFNVPTSLLGMIDASVGGKVGINAYGNKNGLGLFKQAEHVFIYPPFLYTLPEIEMKSALGEAYKCALLRPKMAFAERVLNTEEVDIEDLSWLIDGCLYVKLTQCQDDPEDRGPRNALNLGHTMGHAIESWVIRNSNKISRHGFCVAWGLVYALWLSVKLNEYPVEKFKEHRARICKLFGYPPCIMYEWLEPYLMNDKKGHSGNINFVLLRPDGSNNILPVWPALIEEALICAYQ